MKLSLNSRFVCKPLASAASSARCFSQQRLSRFLTPCCVIVALAGMALHADAATQIYLYDANGTPANVSAAYSYQGHHVYDANSNLIGTVDTANHILDASSHVIGYIQLNQYPDAQDSANLTL